MKRTALPHSVDAEASVLGGILLRNDVLVELADLAPEAFYNPALGSVFAAMRDLEAARKPIDEVTLEDALRKRGVLEAVGGLPALSRMALRVPTADNARHYADIVQDTHAARTLMVALSEAAQLRYGDYGELSAYQADVLARVTAAIATSSRTGPRMARQLASDLARTLDSRYAAAGGLTGVPTGYAELDQATAGLQPTDLVILAARPSMGKTALALCIARNAAERGHPVVVFSLEMSAVQLMERLLCAGAGVSTTALRTGRVRRETLTELGLALPRLGELPMAIDETAALTVHQVRARARRFALEQATDRPGLVVVDYLQLMRGSGRHTTREQVIAEISRGLKALAKDLGWPVLALSQLNRSLEARADKRPQLADLRESGAIEQDADIVLFLYRDEVYHPDTDARGMAELAIAKYRSGATGMKRLRFDAEYTRFCDHAAG